MTMPINQSFKWCANCVHWGGQRTLNGIFHRMEIEQSDEVGPCTKLLGWDHCSYLTSCNYFEKHPGVK